LNKEPEISVLMTCYNEEKTWVIESIESILKQSFSDLELIIVLDEPNNIELKNLLIYYKEKDNRVRLIFNEVNRGLVFSLNEAIKASRGRYLARMDADDISFLDRFEKQYSYLEKNKEVALVGGSVTIIDEVGEELFETNNLGITTESAKKSLFYRNIFFHSTWIFRREVLQELKGYDNLPRTEDIDFLCRLILNGYKVQNLPDKFIKSRVRRSGISYSNNLHQVRSARIIMSSFKESLLSKKEYNPLREIEMLRIIDKDKDAYAKACYMYTQGLSKLRNRRVISGIRDIAVCFFISRDKRKDMYSTIRIKLVNM